MGFSRDGKQAAVASQSSCGSFRTVTGYLVQYSEAGWLLVSTGIYAER